MATLEEEIDLECCSLRYLVCAAQDGDTEAFVELMSRYERLLCARVGEQNHGWLDADDILQEVRLRAFEKIHQLREPDALVGWLVRIAHSITVNSCKHNWRAIAVDPVALEETCISAHHDEDPVSRSEQSDLVREALAGLRKMDRQTLEAFYLDGHSVKMMSEMFGAPVGTIKRRLHQARKRLAKAWGGIQAI